MSLANAAPPDVSIVIPAKNGARYLAESLAAIRSQVTRYVYEIILIDSGSTDDTLAIAARYGVQTHCIPPETFNHGGTRNLGGRLAHPASRYLVYLTQDATPLPGWLDHLVAPLEADPQVAGAFSRHVPRPDCNPLLARQICEVWEQAGTPERVVKRIDDPADFERRKVHYVYFADTSSSLRRSIWQQYPFPVTDFAEDAQWAEAVLRAGYTTVYEPASAVWHSHSFSLAQHYRRNYEHARAMQPFLHGQSLLAASGGAAFQALALVAGDWRYLWREAGRRWWSRCFWALYSPLWHGAAGLASWQAARGRPTPGQLGADETGNAAHT